ncbi:pyridoxamine 5'-phosphate oxidase family protein [Lentibacillus jeotgali]|uniref:pyridoxamine 5'-phosphate oxidase family protein n=1 Tax=Lentibacillus jeotgali TaxID=558169 RepID=UPI0002628B93|nr:pyridoxamine 5'-phosphate oxidase family protein [Lentibacillus jeotgali]
MSQQERKTTIEKIIDDNAVGTMATVKQNKPHSRYMTFIRKGLKLYTATSIETHKSEEIKANPYTHILLGYEGKGFGDEYVEYEGKVAINSSVELKHELWNSYMEYWFNGPDDSNYIVLEITPVTIRIMNKKGAEPKTVEF